MPRRAIARTPTARKKVVVETSPSPSPPPSPVRVPEDGGSSSSESLSSNPIIAILQEHFQAHQEDLESTRDSIASHVSSIKKQIRTWSLDNSLSALSLGGLLHDEEDEEETSVHLVVALQLVQNMDWAASVDIDAPSEDSDAAHRAFDLAAAVAVADADAEQATALEHVTSRAVQYASAKLDRMRAYGARILGGLSCDMAKRLEEQENKLLEESFEDALGTLTNLCTDKSQAVRLAAIDGMGIALSSKDPEFFVQPEEDDSMNNGEPEVTPTGLLKDALEALLWNVWHDPSAPNRAAALHQVPINLETVFHILSRVRDEKPKVRVASLDVLRENLTPNINLEPDHYAAIAQSGLMSRCAQTKKAARNLVCSRILKLSKLDPIVLLQKMDVTDNEEECEKVMEVILDAARNSDDEPFEGLSDPEIRAIRKNVNECVARIAGSDDEFDAASVFYARVFCKTAANCKSISIRKREELFTQTVPDTPVLCELIERHTGKLRIAIESNDAVGEENESFVCLQYLQLAKIVGLGEEGSRRHFARVMKQLLRDIQTPDDLVEGSVKAMEASCNGQGDFIDAVYEVIVHISQVLKDDDAEEEDKIQAHLRVLSILVIVSESASHEFSMHPAMPTFLGFIMPAVTSDINPLRELGVNCLGRVGCLSNQTAVLSDYKPLLLQVASNPKETVDIRSQALLALCDWSTLLADILTPMSISGNEISLEEIVLSLMRHKRASVAAVACEVAFKLLLTGRSSNQEILAQLLVCFFDPGMAGENEEEEEDENSVAITEVGSTARLQQLLSLFFPAYCAKSQAGRVALLESIGRVLERSCHQLPKRGKKRRGTLPVAKVVEYVCGTVNTSKDAQPSVTAIAASKQVVQHLVDRSGDHTVTVVRALCKFVGNREFEINFLEDKPFLFGLKEQMEELGTVITDGTALRSLISLNETLEGVLEKPKKSRNKENARHSPKQQPPKKRTRRVPNNSNIRGGVLAAR